jgi:hypothetical protein
MKKFAGFFALLLLAVVPAVAQDAPSQNTPPPQDSTSQSTSSSQTTPEASPPEKKPISTLFTPKYELSAGFAHRSFYTTGLPKIGMYGAYGSFAYNWKRWLGFEGEIQAVYKTINVTNGGTEKPSVYTALVGPQIYPFKHHKLSPFGHFLYGEGYYREAIGSYSGFPSTVNTYFSRSWEGGGGLDVHLWPKWSVRAGFDYGSTSFGSGGGSGSQGGYRISIGMVRYFGER